MLPTCCDTMRALSKSGDHRFPTVTVSNSRSSSSQKNRLKIARKSPPLEDDSHCDPGFPTASERVNFEFLVGRQLIQYDRVCPHQGALMPRQTRKASYRNQPNRPADQAKRHVKHALAMGHVPEQLCSCTIFDASVFLSFFI